MERCELLEYGIKGRVQWNSTESKVFFKSVKNPLIKKKTVKLCKFTIKSIENSKTKISLSKSKENFKIKI